MGAIELSVKLGGLPESIGRNSLIFLRQQPPNPFGKEKKVTEIGYMMHVIYLVTSDSIVQGVTTGQTRLHYRNRGCKGTQNRVGA